MTIEAAFTNFPVLTTRRLQLRQVRPGDAEALFAVLSDPQVAKFYGHEPHQTVDETRELIEKIQSLYKLWEILRWGITFKGEERLLGTCSLHHFGADYRRAATGYDLNRAFWRQGIMYEAMLAVLAYGFTDLNLHRIEAIIDLRNEGSKGLLLKLGFAYEGNLRERYPFRDHFEDEHYFGLLRREWREQRR